VTRKSPAAAGDLDRAIGDATQAVALDARCAMACGIHDVARRRKGEFESAIADLSEAIRLGDSSYIEELDLARRGEQAPRPTT
jgi:hypothetical protein